MPSYDIFFYAITSFLAGILAASFGISLPFIVVAAFLLAAIFLFWKFLKNNGTDNQKKSLFPGELVIISILIISVLLGAGYYNWNDSKFKDIKITFNKEINFSGLVVDDPQYGSNAQTFTVQLSQPFKGNIQAKLMLYPQFKYGDYLSFKGEIDKPSDLSYIQDSSSYADYLAKEGISGLSDLPQAKLIKSGLGSKIKSALFNFKHSVINSYYRVLPPSQASLLSGLDFGDRSKFTADFKKAMSLSGTTHLTALSGQNITIIVVAIAAVFGFIFPQSLTLIITILVIFGFVAMTGFDPSAVRATIMGFTVLLAGLVGRIYSPRNSIALAAFLIVLANPKVLVFDIGFQLSFLAVLGIIYLRPSLKKLLRLKDEPGFFAWRENFLMTLSAQLATAPFLIIAFNNFSVFAILSNIMILMAIPLTMILGFVIGFVSPFSYFLALIFGWLVSLFLNYEIFIINFFAKIALPLNINFNFFGVLIYYLALIGLIVLLKKRPLDARGL